MGARQPIKEQRVRTSERVELMLADIDKALAGLNVVFVLCRLFGGYPKEDK